MKTGVCSGGSTKSISHRICQMPTGDGGELRNNERQCILWAPALHFAIQFECLLACDSVV
jgi:hypothetical protein